MRTLKIRVVSIAAGVASAALVPALAIATLATPHSFSAGDPIVADELNENFDAVESEVNIVGADGEALEQRVVALEATPQIQTYQLDLTTVNDWTTQQTAVFLNLPDARILSARVASTPQGARATVANGYSQFGSGLHTHPLPHHETVDEFIDDPAGVPNNEVIPYLIIDGRRVGGGVSTSLMLTIDYVE